MTRRLTPQQQAEIGRAVVIARSVDTPWKVLESTYVRSRMQLHRYAVSACEKDVTLAAMLHLSGCQGVPRAA